MAIFMANEAIFEATPAGEWLDARFQDDECGEIFFVELRKQQGETMEEFVERCREIANENFEAPVWIDLVDQEDAEMLGYDTY